MSSVRQHLVAFSALLLTSVPALADPGHLAEERGHTHWVALAAVAGAVAVAGFGFLRGAVRRRREAASAEGK